MAQRDVIRDPLRMSGTNLPLVADDIRRRKKGIEQANHRLLTFIENTKSGFDRREEGKKHVWDQDPDYQLYTRGTILLKLLQEAYLVEMAKKENKPELGHAQKKTAMKLQIHDLKVDRGKTNDANRVLELDTEIAELEKKLRGME